ncbi:MAG: guanylate kinase [Betaproteobacteria bacterium SG8_40]|jgi:guanylate kinase|nr:MAG: guanylate kinase [Betaproteobacteria bacterium SG8_40]
MKGSVIIVSAPSGAGKTSLVKELVERDPATRKSVSHTTRPRRPGEQDGIDYHFVSAGTFQGMLEAGEFLESAEVHGNMYGTGQKWLEEQRRQGSDIVLEIDWQGAKQVRGLMPEAVGIFVLPPSVDTLRGRLTKRAQDSDQVIARRLAAARNEVSHVHEFDYVIINDDFDTAVQDLICIVRSIRLRLTAQLDRNQALINSIK